MLLDKNNSKYFVEYREIGLVIREGSLEDEYFIMETLDNVAKMVRTRLIDMTKNNNLPELDREQIRRELIEQYFFYRNEAQGLFTSMASTNYIIKNMIRIAIDNLVRKFHRAILLADRWNRRKNELPALILQGEASKDNRESTGIDNRGWLFIDPDNASF